MHQQTIVVGGHARPSARLAHPTAVFPRSCPNIAHAEREKWSFVIIDGFGHKVHPRAAAHNSTQCYLLLKSDTVMSTNLSHWWARGAKAPRRPATVKAIPASRGTPIHVKMIIVSVVVLFALLYAKGVTLMIDAADKPSSYATFLYRAD